MMTALETDSRILDAASDLFAERGYNGTTTRAIAERAGVNEVTLFRKFTSKQGILAALTQKWSRSMAGFAVATLPDPSDTRATLEVLAELEVAQARQVGGAAMRLALDAQSTLEVAEIMGSGPSENFAGLVEYLTERQIAGDLRADIDPRVMAEAFFALTSQLVMSRQVLGAVGTRYALPIEEVTRQALDLYLMGITVRG